MRGKGRRGCFTLSCIKTWFLVFAAVLCLLGGGLFGIGIWTLLTKSQYQSLLGTVTFISTIGMMIAAGFFSMFVCIFGITGAIKDDAWRVAGFFVMVFMVCVLELVGGTVAYVYRDSITGEIQESLNVSIASNYGMPGSERKTKAVDFLQEQYRCCGDVDYKSWEKTVWFRTNTRNNRTGIVVPDSCCISPSTNCGRRVHPSNIWRNDYDPKRNGCYQSLRTYFIDHLYIIGIACFASGVAQVICVFLSGWLYRKITAFRVYSRKMT